jgi:hypothetical protein
MFHRFNFGVNIHKLPQRLALSNFPLPRIGVQINGHPLPIKYAGALYAKKNAFANQSEKVAYFY